jgi:hypothetical protein
MVLLNVLGQVLAGVTFEVHRWLADALSLSEHVYMRHRIDFFSLIFTAAWRSS